MSLTDNEILELNELCNAVVDGTLSDAQREKLAQSLSTSLEARQFYIRAMGLSASMYYYASEMQTGAPDAPAATKTINRWKWAISFIGLAACLALFVWMGRPRQPVPAPAPIAVAVAQTNVVEYVARLTAGSRDREWAAGKMAPQLGELLPKGQRMELAKGAALITFDSGAQVLLDAPASLDVNSAWSATLNRGTLKASVPPEAMGFSISNPTVEVVDIGTQFTMFADASGAATEVLVLQGEVEAAPRAPDDQQPVALREKDSRLFTSSGVSSVHNSEQKFRELTESAQLDYFVSPTGYAHWSFDETEGDLFKADVSDATLDASEAQVQGVSPSGVLSSVHVKGHVKGALKFDGHMYAKAEFPSISENTPHTVLFWVKVPREASLSNAYAMASWGVKNKNLVSKPTVNIDWNRNHDDGALGVLRTDYYGGFALGATDLRDGRWHHIAVVFIPRDDSQTPVEVKQYVDGRLEGEGKPSPPLSDISPGDNSQLINGYVWLGCRVGIRTGGARADRFYGAMDELFIADRALEPQDIVSLMNTNQLPQEKDAGSPSKSLLSQ